MPEYETSDIVEISSQLYTEGPLFMRQLQIWRPWICPFQELIEAVPKNARILDVGCGGGLFLGLLAKAGRISYGHGFDSSKAAIEIANRMRSNHPAKDTLVYEYRDVTQEWPEEEFDVVSLIDIIHHVPKDGQQHVISQAAEHISPGGMLLYKDVSEIPLWRAMASQLHDLLIARQWIHIPSFVNVVRWAMAAGLKPENHFRIDMLWYGHEIAVFRQPEA